MSDDGYSKRLKNALKTVLATVAYNGEPAFTSILDNTSGEFDGYPILRILPADVTTEKVSVAENERRVNFVLRVTMPLENGAVSESAAYDKMYDLTDLIIDKMDDGDFDHDIEQTDPTLHTLILNATRGDWSVAETDSAVVVMCDVNVEIRYSRDLA